MQQKYAKRRDPPSLRYYLKKKHGNYKTQNATNEIDIVGFSCNW